MGDYPAGLVGSAAGGSKVVVLPESDSALPVAGAAACGSGVGLGGSAFLHPTKKMLATAAAKTRCELSFI
jgi:hypothetical protein